MATYNNKHWLLSHIRNSYIATDDTGMCEAIMLSDDLPNRYIDACKARRTPHLPHTSSKSHYHTRAGIDENYEWYPGLDHSDDEDLDPLSQSYDIQMDQDYGLRKHNTASSHKFDKIEANKRRASRIRSIKLEDNVPALTDTEIDELFTRRTDFKPATNGHGDAEKPESLLAQRLEEVRRKPVNKFQTYARFDGNQMSVPIKSFKIFLTMLPKDQQNYPMEICVVATARIQEFIGLICYKCSITYTDVPLLSVQNYGLYITEGDGEIDDFPPLDLREPCSKFRFSHLALVERKNPDPVLRQDSRPISETDSTLNSPNQDTIDSYTSNNLQDLERMKGHTIQMEAPLYRSYRVKMFTKGIFKTDIQLGISGEKLEIDPVQPQNSKFFRQKPISHSMESVVWCDIEESSRTRVVIRIVYSPSSDAMQHQHSQAHNAFDINSSFRHYDLVTNPVLAAEIVEKINNIIEVRSSSNRREYLSRHPNVTKKKKLTFSFK